MLENIKHSLWRPLGTGLCALALTACFSDLVKEQGEEGFLRCSGTVHHETAKHSTSYMLRVISDADGDFAGVEFKSLDGENGVILSPAYFVLDLCAEDTNNKCTERVGGKTKKFDSIWSVYNTSNQSLLNIMFNGSAIDIQAQIPNDKIYEITSCQPLFNIGRLMELK